jgi:hypothetical protein
MYDRPPENSQSQSNDRKKLTSDELIALFLALTTIGGLLFWLLGCKDEGWNLNLLSDSETISTPSLSVGGDSNNKPWQLGSQIDTQNSIATAGIPRSNNNRDKNRSNNGEGNNSSLIDPFNFSTITSAKKDNSANSTNSFSFNDLFLSARGEESSDKNSLKADNNSNNNNQTKTDNTDKNNQPATQVFADVPNDYWARQFIEKLAEQKTIEGFTNGNFEPDRPISRSELAAAINKAFPNSTNKINLTFKDVKAGSEQEKSIEGAISSGFMKGYPEGDFQPDKPVTRLQALVALATGLKLQTLQNPADVLILFQDSKNVPKWATKQIAAATDKGLVVNYPDLKVLDPNRPATRSEVAVMLYQALVISGKVPKIDSQYIVTQGK